MQRGIGRLRAGGSVIEPATLFAAGEAGAHFDLRNWTSDLWQDSARTTPVTAVEQSVGAWRGLTSSGYVYATQGTSGSRPILTSRVNLCTNNNYSPSGLTGVAKAGDAASVLSVVSDTAAIAAAGLSSACPPGNVYKLDNSAGTGLAWAEVSGTASAAGGSHVASAYIRSTGNATIAIQGNGAAYSSYAAYTRVSKTYTSAAASSDKLQVYAQAGAIVYFILNDLRTSDDAAKNIPAYQRVNTSTDYDTNGFPLSLKFDGTDDSLQVSAFDMSSVDKVAIWTGLKKSSDSAAAILAELTVSGSATDGGFYLGAPGSAAGNFGSATRGATAASAGTVATFTAPITKVLTQQLDNSAATNALQNVVRVNGANQTVTFSTGPTSAGNFANSALNIGRRNNASLPFNGRLSSLTIRGTSAATDSLTLQRMEQFVARQIAVSLT